MSMPSRFRTLLIIVAAISAVSSAPLIGGQGEFNPKGNYGGIVQQDSAFDPVNAGLIELKVTRSGEFTGKLVWIGVRYRFSGNFEPDSLSFEETFDKADDSATSLVMKLTLDPLALQIAASVSEVNNGTTGITAFGSLSGAPPDPAAADAYRGTTNVSFINSPNYGTGADSIGGDGFLIVKVGKNKSLASRFVGRLPDDEPFTAASPLRGTNFAIIAALYKRGGVVGGQALGPVSAANPDELDATILWGKKANVDPDYYPDEILTGVFISAGPYPKIGGRRVPPIGISKSKLLVTLKFRDGNIGRLQNGDPIVVEVPMKILPYQTKVIGDNPLEVKMFTNGARGTFKGSFIHPISKQKTKFHGAFKPSLSDTPGEGRGSFKGTVDENDPERGPRQSGSVRIIVTPRP